jgi:4-amino-4-deoxy-L-arabinose transferase-like glycosyltransferase
LSHLWQRFLLASALLIGLAIGVGATVFGYDNTTRIDLNWTVFHIHGVPVWAVAVVPVTLVLVAGTLFHWMNGLHHFTEHMRHRRRVHELEAELATLRAHLDQVLEMPAVSSNKQVQRKESPPALPEANGGLDDIMANEPEPVVAEAEPAADTPPASKRSRKRVKLEFGDEPRANVVDVAGDGTPPETEVPEKEA